MQQIWPDCRFSQRKGEAPRHVLCPPLHLKSAIPTPKIRLALLSRRASSIHLILEGRRGTYGDGVHGVAQVELPARHHGLPGAPACAAHRTPPGAHPNLHPALVRAAAAH